MQHTEQRYVHYKIDHTPNLLAQLRTQVNGEEDGPFVNFDYPDVKSRVFATKLLEDLSIYIGEIEVLEAFSVARDGTMNPELVVVDFQIDTFAHLLLEDDQPTKYLVTGGYLASSEFESGAEYQKGFNSKFVTYIFNRSWLLNAFADQAYPIHQFLKENNRYFLFREIDVHIANELADLFNHVFSSEAPNEQYILGSTLKVLSSYFERFTSEMNGQPQIAERDMEGMQEAKDYIDRNVDKKIEMQDLLRIAAMSESKFRNLFRTMYGCSPFDYYKKAKLWYAKSLIERGEMISNVVTTIGYTNHSYFTRSFKQSFGITPRAYQNAIKSLKTN